MIYIDDEGVTNIEYGHGSIFGFETEVVDGTATYALCSSDKGELNRECTIWESVKGKPDTAVFPSVRFIFHKKQSLKILIDALQEIHERMD
jgi:hypothetical protein